MHENVFGRLGSGKPRRLVRFAAASLAAGVLVAGGLLWYRRAIPTVRHVQLPDRTEAWLRKDAQLRVSDDFARTRTIETDGEILLKVAPGVQPLRIRAPVLVATVSAPALLVVTSSAKDAGAQVEVLTGAADIEPAYPSRWHESAHAVAGEIVLLSRDIDLMEQETIRSNDIPSWVSEYVPSSATGSRRP